MEEINIWIMENKEWFFSGIGVSSITAVVSIINVVFKRKQKSSNIQKQKSGKNSINIQVGGDFNVKKE